MSDPGFTPGQWAYDSAEPPAGGEPLIYATLPSGEMVGIAEVLEPEHEGADPGEWDANGRLMAAAPELWALCEQAFGLLKDALFHGTADPQSQAAIDNWGGRFLTIRSTAIRTAYGPDE